MTHPFSMIRQALRTELHCLTIRYVRGEDHDYALSRLLVHGQPAVGAARGRSGSAACKMRPVFSENYIRM
jgi:hypothetical protein